MTEVLISGTKGNNCEMDLAWFRSVCHSTFSAATILSVVENKQSSHTISVKTNRGINHKWISFASQTFKHITESTRLKMAQASAWFPRGWNELEIQKVYFLDHLILFTT